MATQSLVVPMIDMVNFPVELNKLATAVTELGYFRVINHGIPTSLLMEIKAIVRSLFELPVEAKLRNFNDKINNGGYVSLGKITRLLEALGIYNAASPADVNSFCSDMQVSPHQREIISEYIANLHMVMMRIASKLAESLDLVNRSFQDWSCEVKFFHYNFHFQEDIGYIASPNHTDSGFLTLLHEDECVRGLEIMNTNGNFMTIDPVPETFLFFVGDTGKAWSNGRLANSQHRVVCKEAMPRISILLFLYSPKDDKIEPEAAFIDSNHPRLYQTFNYKEYKKLRYLSGVHTDENLPRWNKD